MKTCIQYLCITTFVCCMVIACQTKKEEVPAGSVQSDTVAKQSVRSAPAIDTTTVFNANLATEKDFQSVGLSTEVISQIMEARPFTSMKDFEALVQLSDTRNDLYSSVFVPMNLNTTSEEDFKLIPGVGDRMAHEFEEYKPYTSVKQFRKEIGKYVDDKEIARYEHYVFVPVELNTASEEDIKALPGVGDRMAHEFEEYRPYSSMEQFKKEIGKYVDDKELARLVRLVYIK